MSKSSVERVYDEQTVTFTSGSTVSSIADIRKRDSVGFMTSTAFGSSQVTFRVGPSSSSDATFYDLYDGATQASMVVSTAAARACVASNNPNLFAPWPFLQVVGNSTADSARIWTLAMK